MRPASTNLEIDANKAGRKEEEEGEEKQVQPRVVTTVLSIPTPVVQHSYSAIGY